MDTESGSSFEPAGFEHANAHISTEASRSFSPSPTPLTVQRKTSPGLPNPSHTPQDHVATPPDDFWNSAPDIPLEDDGYNTEDEPLLPLPQVQTDEYDQNALTEDPSTTETMTELQNTVSHTYASINKTADALKVDVHALREFLIDNADVLEIASDHMSSYVKPQKALGSGANKGHTMQTIVTRILDSEHAQLASPYRAPPKSKLAAFDPIDMLAYSVCRMHDRLDDSGLLNARWDARSRYQAGFLALKARETLDQTARKLEQATNAHNTFVEARKQKRNDQLSRRSTNAATIATLSPAKDGQLPPPPTLRKDRTSTRPEQAAEDTPQPSDQNDGAAVAAQPIPESAAEIMDLLLAQTERHQKNDPHEKERRSRVLALGQITMEGRIERLLADPQRTGAYRNIQSLLRDSVNDFFDDFTEVDVSTYREACLARFQTMKPTVQSVRADDIRSTLDVSKADKDKEKEHTAAALGSQWAGEEARALIQTGAVQTEDKMDVVDTVDLPPPSQAYKDTASSWSKMINSLEYQDERLKAALTRCYITNTTAMRVPFQNAAIHLHWWQVICVAWMDNVVRRFGNETKVNGHTGWTKGGLVADEIGLGKTTEYVASILVDIKEHQDAYAAAPDDQKPDCRPILILTLPSLVAQTTDEIRKVSKKPYIVVLHNASNINTSSSTVQVTSSSRLAPLWDKANTKNLRTVLVSSYDTFSRHYGPVAQNSWNAQRQANFKPPLKGTQPAPDPTCPTHPAGLVRSVIVDEPQVGCRNQSSYWTTVKWLDADQVFLYSGSPAPRGLNDIASYLGLFEHTDVAIDAQRAHTVTGDIVWTPDTNPYTLPDDDPRCKFRYTRFCLLAHIVDAHSLGDYEKGMLAKKVMPHFILRRDYQSQCPFNSGNSIAKNLPDLTHFSLERTFSPSAKGLYDRVMDHWRHRLVLHEKDQATGEVRRMPNPRAYRADALQVWYPYTNWLHVPNPHFEKQDDDTETPVDSQSARETDPDYYSWFSETSNHWGCMPGISANLRQHRWILARAIYLREKTEPGAPVDVALLPYRDRKQVSNARVLREILKWSPKVGAILALLLKHVLLMDEKVLIWFTYPQTLKMFQEILMVFPYFREGGRTMVLNATTSGQDRRKLQTRINDLDDPLRIVLASNKVGAVGLNYQMGCWTQIHADLAETLDNEIQAIGRSYRLGALIAVLIYSLMVAGSLDATSVEKMITRALASTVAMMEHNAPNDNPSATADPAPYDHMEGFFELRDGDAPPQILHFRTKEGKAAVEKLRKLKEDDGEFDDEPSLRHTWLPEALDAAEATKRLMLCARANVVLQHGSTGAAAVTDLSLVVMEEILGRIRSAQPSDDESQAEEEEKENPPPASQAEEEKTEEPRYDPDADPIFLSGHVTFSAPQHEMPVRERRKELLSPSGVYPTDKEWEAMSDSTKRSFRQMLESRSKARQDHERLWDTPASRVRPKRKPKVENGGTSSKGKERVTEGEVENGGASSKGKERVTEDEGEVENGGASSKKKKKEEGDGRKRKAEDDDNEDGDGGGGRKRNKEDNEGGAGKPSKVTVLKVGSGRLRTVKNKDAGEPETTPPGTGNKKPTRRSSRTTQPRHS